MNYITEFKVCVFFCNTCFIWFVWIVRIGFETWQNSIRQNEQWLFYVFVRRIQFAAISMPHLAVALFSMLCDLIFFLLLISCVWNEFDFALLFVAYSSLKSSARLKTQFNILDSFSISSVHERFLYANVDAQSFSSHHIRNVHYEIVHRHTHTATTTILHRAKGKTHIEHTKKNKINGSHIQNEYERSHISCIRPLTTYSYGWQKSIFVGLSKRQLIFCLRFKSFWC